MNNGNNKFNIYVPTKFKYQNIGKRTQSITVHLSFGFTINILKEQYSHIYLNIYLKKTYDYIFNYLFY